MVVTGSAGNRCRPVSIRWTARSSRLDGAVTLWQAGAAGSVAAAEMGEGRAKGGDGIAALLPAVRQQIRQVDQADLARHPGQHVAEVLERIDADEPARAEDRIRDRGSLGAAV